MSDSQQRTAFQRSRVIVDPNQGAALASFQFMYGDHEACPSEPYMNPVGYGDYAVNAPICVPNPGALSDVYQADETLRGGATNPNGLVQYGLLRNGYDISMAANYLNNE